MMRLVLALPVVLSACAAVVVVPGAPQRKSGDLASRVLLECRMLEEAQATLRARGQTAPSDIVVGCPGHEGVTDSMPLKAQTAALRTANAAQLPASVQRQGTEAARIYRRMITRGVPESLAQEIAQGERFAAAVRG